MLYHFKKDEVKAIKLSKGDQSVKITDEKDIAEIVDALNSQIFITTIYPREEKEGLLGFRFLDSENQQIKWLTYDSEESRLYPLGGKLSKKTKSIIDRIIEKYDVNSASTKIL